MSRIIAILKEIKNDRHSSTDDRGNIDVDSGG